MARFMVALIPRGMRRVVPPRRLSGEYCRLWLWQDKTYADLMWQSPEKPYPNLASSRGGRAAQNRVAIASAGLSIFGFAPIRHRPSGLISFDCFFKFRDPRLLIYF